MCILEVWATFIGIHLTTEPAVSTVVTKCWNWELILATNFGNQCTNGHHWWWPKFGCQLWLCTRLISYVCWCIFGNKFSEFENFHFDFDFPVLQGQTRLMLTRIPFFKEVIISSFSCDHCGHTDSEVQFGGRIQEKGQRISAKIQNAKVGFRARFLSLTQSKLRLCLANHRAGYFSNLACDWLRTVGAYSEQETENGPRTSPIFT